MKITSISFLTGYFAKLLSVLPENVSGGKPHGPILFLLTSSFHIPPSNWAAALCVLQDILSSIPSTLFALFTPALNNAELF